MRKAPASLVVRLFQNVLVHYHNGVASQRLFLLAFMGTANAFCSA